MANIEKCYNGCGKQLPMWELIQINNGQGQLMLVCEDCLIEDRDLADWEVDFVKDPR